MKHKRNSNPVGACPWKEIILQWVSLTYHKALFSCVDTCTEQSPCWPENQETQNLPAMQVPIMEGTGAFPVVFQVSWVCAQDWQCWRSLQSLIRPAANFTNTVVQIPLSQRPYYETWEVAFSARVCISTEKKKSKLYYGVESSWELLVSSDSLSSRYFVRQGIWSFDTVLLCCYSWPGFISA